MENEAEGALEAQAPDPAAAADAAAEAAAAQALTVDAGHGDPTLGVGEVAMPQLDFALYPNLIFWLIVALAAIYLILTRVALPRIGTIIAERNDAISNDLEYAALLKRRATEAEAAYQAALARAREEAQKIGAEAKAAIGRELAALTAKADAEIAARAAESEARIREIEASAAESVSAVARDVAGAIVARIGPKAAEASTIDAAVAARLGG